VPCVAGGHNSPLTPPVQLLDGALSSMTQVTILSWSVKCVVASHYEVSGAHAAGVNLDTNYSTCGLCVLNGELLMSVVGN